VNKKINNIFLLSIFLNSFFIYSTDDYSQKYSNNCSAYTDPFGPLKTGYSMGDAIRYAVGDNVNNVYSPGGAVALKNDKLAAAQDIKSFGNNTGNLYNAIGYLYAGWLVFNNPLYQNLNGIDNSNHKLIYYNAPDVWLSWYRNNQQYSLHRFDNSENFCNFIEIPSSYSVLMPPQVTSKITGSSGQPMTFNNRKNIPVSYVSVGYNFINPGDGSQTYGKDSFSNVQSPHTHADWASQSSGWCPNTGSGDWIGVIHDNSNNKFVAPTIQFFGARIAHILGVIVNDVPWQGVAQTGGSASPTPAFTSPLISGQDGKGTELPMFAVMSDGPWSSVANAPQEMIQPSTAHFGSINSFLGNISGSGSAYNYLKNHLEPTVSRLSQLFSYSISINTNSLNLLQINDSNVTPMDQGVIACIQNNTTDNLIVSQVISATPVNIGILNPGVNNFYLHTASLVSASSNSIATASNMIVIEDKQAEGKFKNTNFADVKNATYIQVLQKNDMESLVTAFNHLLGTGGYTYNQNNISPTTFADNYLVITNFDPTLSSGALANISSNQQAYDCYRIQIIDIDEFSNKPYLVTVQINKENLGYGLLTSDNTQGQIAKAKVNTGNSNVSILYPSITSIKECTWQNIINIKQKKGHSKIPLLMIPDFVWNAGITGLQAYYLIWLMSYAAALTECSYNGANFGDQIDLYDKVFGLFSNKPQVGDENKILSGYSSQNYQVVIDAQSNLASGQALQLDKDISIVGCGVLDAGGGFNQDIPVLNVSSSGSDEYGNPVPVANSVNASFINLSATFGSQASVQTKTFKNSYGLPYGNVMMFSLPTQALKDGVSVEIIKSIDTYQLIITSTLEFTDSDNNTVPSGSVLVAPKIVVDSELYNVSDIVFDFLHVNGTTAWNNPQSIKIAKAVSTEQYNLKYSTVNSKNNLILQSSSSTTTTTQKKISQSAAKTKSNLSDIKSKIKFNTVKTKNVTALKNKSTSPDTVSMNALQEKNLKLTKSNQELQNEIQTLENEIKSSKKK